MVIYWAKGTLRHKLAMSVTKWKWLKSIITLTLTGQQIAQNSSLRANESIWNGCWRLTWIIPLIIKLYMWSVYNRYMCHNYHESKSQCFYMFCSQCVLFIMDSMSPYKSWHECFSFFARRKKIFLRYFVWNGSLRASIYAAIPRTEEVIIPPIKGIMDRILRVRILEMSAHNRHQKPNMKC